MLKSMINAALTRAHQIRDRHVTLLQQFLRPINSQYEIRKILEEKLAEKVVIWRRLRVEQREDRTAQFFQSVGRGYMLRRDLMPVLQRRARILSQKKFEAARTIQCAWKSSVARDELRMKKESKQRHIEHQRVWGEVQAQLHTDRVSAVALAEQSGRLSIVKTQKEIRKAIITGFFYQESMLLLVMNNNDNNQDQDQQNIDSPSSTQQQNWEQQQQQETKKERILRMYDDSDEEEQDAFVQQILSQKI